MNIGFGDLRQFKIDDMTDAVDVDAARRDVGRNERARFSGAEGGQRALALALALIAMNDGSVDARLIECAADAIGAVLGAGEDEDAGELGIVEQLDQEVALLRRFDKKDVVLDAVGGLGRRESPRPRSGSCSNSPASARMSVGIVAEKNRFCRFLGNSRTMRRIGLTKPRSSI